MNEKVKETLTDMAVELAVAPVALGVMAVQAKRKVENMPTKSGGTVRSDIGDAAKKTKVVITETAKKVYETDAAQKVTSAVKDGARKVADSDTARKIQDAAGKVTDAVKDIADKARDSVAPADETAEAEAPVEEAKAECAETVAECAETVAEEVKEENAAADTLTE